MGNVIFRGHFLAFTACWRLLVKGGREETRKEYKFSLGHLLTKDCA